MKQKLPQKIPITVSGKVVSERLKLKTTKKTPALCSPQKSPQINSTTESIQLNPCRHAEKVAEYASASEQDTNAAIDAALAAKPAWEALPFEDRAAVFLRAAELISGKYRSEILAATMLGMGKNIRQAEVDASTETIDFLRQYVKEAEKLFEQQPPVNLDGTWNRNEFRPLEGFVYAISPFNFTALAATLVGPPALLGNVVIWKPSDSALHASWVLYQILLEAGLPKDVIQFLPGNPELITDTVLKRPEFAGLAFIGSTAVFKELQGKVGKATAEGRFNSYPRVVGETGGKNFHLVTESADVKSAALNTLRAAFEYQGQKCSACSRVYVAESIWPEFKSHIQHHTSQLRVGPPEDYSAFVNAVIHERSFNKLSSVIHDAKSDPELHLLAGGTVDNSSGFYIHPTIYQTTNPTHPLMSTELFGPIFCIYVYPDEKLDETLHLINCTSRYALTGSVFAHDPMISRKVQNALKHAAGNFYVNTKCTGSVVGQQPFGGMRDSGTNDKSGTMGMLMRFASVRTIKEEFASLEEVGYPSNEI